MLNGDQFPSLPKKSKASKIPSEFLTSRPSANPSMSYMNAVVNNYSRLKRGGPSFINMIRDPFTKEFACRYPDETIVPTALVHLLSSTSYTVPPGTSSFATYLSWKVDNTYLPINPPTTFGTPFAAVSYGTPQTTWETVSSNDRTLAMGIRIRNIALPISTFKPAGTLYFIQLQANEDIQNYSTEDVCLQAVTAGKGYYFTVQELGESAASVFYLPQGPMSYVFSNTGADAAIIGINGVVSPNGYVAMIGFGVQPGLTFRMDYAHHVEYIPKPSAAGIISTRVEPPSSNVREMISRGAQSLQQRIAGSQTFKSIADVVTSGAQQAVSQAAMSAAKYGMDYLRRAGATGAAAARSAGPLVQEVLEDGGLLALELL